MVLRMSFTGFASSLIATKQNHALEHATIALLLERTGINSKIAGRAGVGCFYIYGNQPTELIKEAAYEALDRLKNGEHELAISPFCGTNIAVSGGLAGLASLIALGSGNRLLNMPRVLIAAIVAVILGQSIGKLAQKHFTITSDIENMEIMKITRSGWGPAGTHKIETTTNRLAS